MPADPNHAITRSPSVTGVAEANGFVSCVGSFSGYSAPHCHSTLPSLRLTHMRVRRAPTGCVRNTLSPQTIGDELPGSGNSVFQRTFCVALHFNGKLFSEETPLPSLRQPGQLAAGR